MKNLNFLRNPKGRRDGARSEVLTLLLNWATGGYGVRGEMTCDPFCASGGES